MMLGKMRTKPCRVCKVSKTIRNFYKHPTTVDGYMNICRLCHKEYTYANKELKREQYNAKRRIRQNSPEAKAKRAAYLARPEVKAMLKETYRINCIIKRDLKLESRGIK